MKGQNRKIKISFAICLMLIGNSLAQQNISIIRGLNGWLFLDLPMSSPAVYKQRAGMVSVINNMLKYKGISMVFAVAPMPQHIYPENLPAGYQVDPVFNGLYQSFNTAVTSQGVIAPDILNEFLKLKKTNLPDLLYFPNDYHWSEIGGLEAAKIVAKSIVSNKLPLSDHEPVAFSLRLLSPRPLKDRLFLASHLSESEKAKWQASFNYTSVPIDVKRPKGQDEDLLSDNVPEIALVGTSYSGSSKGFAPSLPYALQQDVLDASKGGSGPWAPLMEYVMGDNFQKTPPKVLVWEFPELEIPIYVSGTDVGSPRVWLSRLAPYIIGDCIGKSQEVKTSAASLDIFNQIIQTSSSTKSIHISVPLNTNYISFDVISSGPREMTVTLNSGKNTSKQVIPLVGDVSKRRAFLNLSGEKFDRAESITFSVVGSGKVTVNNAKACMLPNQIAANIKDFK